MGIKDTDGTNAEYNRVFSFVSFVSFVLVAAAASPIAQSKKPTSEQWDQIRPLFKVVEEVAAGSPAPSDLGLRWQCHFVNAEAGVVFVPFTVKIERGEFTSFPVAMYLRVVARGAPAPAPGPRDALAQYPFEDAAVFDRPLEGRISRGFLAPPGEYDVYVALTEKPTPEAPQPKTVVLKQPVSVPDLRSDLAVSSIIVVERVEVDPNNRRLNAEEQLDEPYALWGTVLTPAMRDTFRQSEKLAVIFLVYNTGADANGKPDVEVRYRFHRKASAAETFFTSTKPEIFNADTLRPEFNLLAGDLIIAGQQMPLSRFPEGDYRLEITVVDRVARKSLVRDVNFRVSGS